MAVEIRVPPLGESLVDAIVGQWLKSEGEEVSRGETVLQLETDKVNLDVTAPEDGVLSHIEKREGAVVTVGEVLGVVGPNGASAAAAVASAASTEPATPTAGPSRPTAQPTRRRRSRRRRSRRRRRRRSCRPRRKMAVPAAPPPACAGWRRSCTSIWRQSPAPAPAGASRGRMCWRPLVRRSPRPRRPPPRSPPPSPRRPSPQRLPGRAHRRRRRSRRAGPGRTGGAGALLPAAADDRPAAGRGAADGGDVDDLQRGRHVGGDGGAGPAQGDVQGAARDRAWLHVLLHQSRRSAR